MKITRFALGIRFAAMAEQGMGNVIFAAMRNSQGKYSKAYSPCSR